MNKFSTLLQGGDLRSIGKANEIVEMVQSQQDFDELFNCLFYSDRKVVMRSADAIEKISLNNADFIQKHKRQILILSQDALNIELKWHLALLLPRLHLNELESSKVWDTLSQWAMDKEESKIVRVNAVQGLFNMKPLELTKSQELNDILEGIKKENIPSLNARIKKLVKE